MKKEISKKPCPEVSLFPAEPVYYDYSKSLRDLYNNDGTAVFGKENLNLLPEIRRKFPFDSPQFKETEAFLRTYSYIDAKTLTSDKPAEEAADAKPRTDTKGKAKLSYNMRDFFRAFNGDPIQSFLYNAVIYNMEVESWFGEKAKPGSKIIEEISNAVSRLYVDQWRLNICIGRTAYVKEEVDFELMHCICSELRSRFPFCNEIILEEGKLIYEEEKEIREYVDSCRNNDDNEKYIKAFTKKVFIKNILSRVTSSKNIKFEKNSHGFQKFAENMMKTNKSNPISSRSGFWKCISETSPRDSSDFLSISGGLIPTKDDIYVLSIACGIDFDSYQDLVKSAEDDICDSSPYSNNKKNNRDDIIQDCIRENDTAYKMIFAEDNHLNWRTVAIEDTKKDSLLPLKALIRADRILYDNIKHYSETPEDFLLYHNYMLNRRNSQEYSSKFGAWKADPKNAGKSVIEFEYTYLRYREG